MASAKLTEALRLLITVIWLCRRGGRADADFPGGHFGPHGALEGDARGQEAAQLGHHQPVLGGKSDQVVTSYEVADSENVRPDQDHCNPIRNDLLDIGHSSSHLL